MAYPITERFTSRRGEKFALGITVENLAGMGGFGMLAFMLGGSVTPPLRFAIALLAAVLGFLLTHERAGMLVIERAIWRLRGQTRIWLSGANISPDDLPGTRSVAKGQRVVRRDGVVRKSRRHAGEAVLTSQGRRSWVVRPRAVVVDSPDVSDAATLAPAIDRRSTR